MAPESEANTGSESDQPQAISAPRPGRRSGRGRRGGRGRGRGRGGRSQYSEPPKESSQSEIGAESVSQTPATTEAQSDLPVSSGQESRAAKSEPALRTAIDEVNKIIETLRESLEDMEEVLETLELVERQQNADDQEVEMLRRQLRTLRRPREGGS